MAFWELAASVMGQGLEDVWDVKTPSVPAEAASPKLSEVNKYTDVVKTTKAKILGPAKFTDLCERLKRGDFKKVLVLCGAGISVSCGIPDFRSPTGLYATIYKSGLLRFAMDPMKMFDIEYFRSDPNPFYKLAGELFKGEPLPSVTHSFIKELEDNGILLRCYTQNIDGLERVAGVSSNRLVEAHGSISGVTCIKCKRKGPKEIFQRGALAGEAPICNEGGCSGFLKPDVVFFGENLPKKYYDLVVKDCKDADLLFIIGTSLKVQPVASIPGMVGATVPRVLLNQEPVGIWSPERFSHWKFYRQKVHKEPWIASDSDDGFTLGDGGLKFFEFGNKRDWFLKGSSDDGCLAITNKLGWKLLEEHREMKKQVKGLRTKHTH